MVVDLVGDYYLFLISLLIKGVLIFYFELLEKVSLSFMIFKVALVIVLIDLVLGLVVDLIVLGAVFWVVMVLDFVLMVNLINVFGFIFVF